MSDPVSSQEFVSVWKHKSQLNCMNYKHTIVSVSLLINCHKLGVIKRVRPKINFRTIVRLGLQIRLRLSHAEVSVTLTFAVSENS